MAFSAGGMFFEVNVKEKKLTITLVHVKEKQNRKVRAIHAVVLIVVDSR